MIEETLKQRIEGMKNENQKNSDSFEIEGRNVFNIRSFEAPEIKEDKKNLSK